MDQKFKGDDDVPMVANVLDVPEKAVYMVFLTIFIDILAATISTPVMPFYAKMFDATKRQIGFLFAAWSFCSTVFAPVLGRLSDKFGRRPILITALIGAGFANLFQGLSAYTIPYSIKWFGDKIYAFYVFGFFRGFSGVFAAIGTVTTVYIQDVVPKPLLADYMAKMGVVGPLAFTFGPGMGGGLATIGGNNMPVMVDGIITLFSAFLVASNLPETPAFLKMKEKQLRQGQGAGAASKDEEPKLQWQVYILSLGAFFGGLNMSAFVSMLAIYLHEEYKLDVLHVTYVMVGNAVTLVFTGMFISGRAKNLLGFKGAIVAANLVGAVIYIAMSKQVENLFSWKPLNSSIGFFVACIWLNSVQSSISTASTSPLLSEFTVTANRGKVNSMYALCQNLGRMVGPLLYGQLAETDINLVWLIAGLALAVRALLTVFVVQPKAAPAKLERGKTSYGEKWADEVGSKDDQEAMGKFVVSLLTKGHYKWISRRSEVETLLADLLPELSVESKEAYEKQFHELEMSAHELHSSK